MSPPVPDEAPTPRRPHSPSRYLESLQSLDISSLTPDTLLTRLQRSGAMDRVRLAIEKRMRAASETHTADTESHAHAFLNDAVPRGASVPPPAQLMARTQTAVLASVKDRIRREVDSATREDRGFKGWFRDMIAQEIIKAPKDDAPDVKESATELKGAEGAKAILNSVAKTVAEKKDALAAVDTGKVNSGVGGMPNGTPCAKEGAGAHAVLPAATAAQVNAKPVQLNMRAEKATLKQKGDGKEGHRDPAGRQRGENHDAAPQRLQSRDTPKPTPKAEQKPVLAHDPPSSRTATEKAETETRKDTHEKTRPSTKRLARSTETADTRPCDANLEAVAEAFLLGEDLSDMEEPETTISRDNKLRSPVLARNKTDVDDDAAQDDVKREAKGLPIDDIETRATSTPLQDTKSRPSTRSGVEAETESPSEGLRRAEATRDFDDAQEANLSRKAEPEAQGHGNIETSDPDKALTRTGEDDGSLVLEEGCRKITGDTEATIASPSGGMKRKAEGDEKATGTNNTKAKAKAASPGEARDDGNGLIDGAGREKTASSGEEDIEMDIDPQRKEACGGEAPRESERDEKLARPIKSKDEAEDKSRGTVGGVAENEEEREDLQETKGSAKDGGTVKSEPGGTEVMESHATVAQTREESREASKGESHGVKGRGPPDAEATATPEGAMEPTRETAEQLASTDLDSKTPSATARKSPRLRNKAQTADAISVDSMDMDNVREGNVNETPKPEERDGSPPRPTSVAHQETRQAETDKLSGRKGRRRISSEQRQDDTDSPTVEHEARPAFTRRSSRRSSGRMQHRVSEDERARAASRRKNSERTTSHDDGAAPKKRARGTAGAHGARKRERGKLGLHEDSKVSSDKNGGKGKRGRAENNSNDKLDLPCYETGNLDPMDPNRPRGYGYERQCVPEDFELQRIVLDALTDVMKMPCAEPFVEPVDTSEEGCDAYTTKIMNPMDLGEIQKRLIRSTAENGYYRNVREVLEDVELVWWNCEKFNGALDRLTADVRKMQFALNVSLEQVGIWAKQPRVKRRRSSRGGLTARVEPGASATRDSPQNVAGDSGSDDNDGRLVGKSVLVFTSRQRWKKEWFVVKVKSYDLKSKSYTLSWEDSGKLTKKATFGPGKTYPVYRLMEE